MRIIGVGADTVEAEDQVGERDAGSELQRIDTAVGLLALGLRQAAADIDAGTLDEI